MQQDKSNKCDLQTGNLRLKVDTICLLQKKIIVNNCTFNSEVYY